MPVRIATVRDLQSAEYLKSVALAEKRPERALPLWQTARALDPDSGTIAAHEGFALLGCKRVDEAIERLGAAFARWPRMVHIANLFGVALSERGHYRTAARLFEHILSLDPDYPNAATSLEDTRAARRRSVPPPPAARAAVVDGLALARERPRPTLAMCMIAKNEEAFIGDALASVKGLADEIIVVDTGSSDRTVEICEAAGATVGHFPWIGDFSAARNASLDLATSDWILALDADERLTESSRSAVRAVMEEFQDDDALRVICVRINNYTRDGERFIGDGFSGRLFRNRPDLRFEGRVHEEVARGQADVSTDYRLDIQFTHLGADPEVIRDKGKDERNIELLEARLIESPEDLMTWFYLASQHWIAGRRGPSVDAFERVVELYDRDPSRYGLAVRQVPVPYSHVGLARAYLDRGAIEQARAIGERGLSRFPDNPDLLYHTGLAHAAAGDSEQARARLLAAAETPLSGYGLIGMHDKKISAWKARKAVADLDFEAEAPTARAGYEAVWPALPDELPERIVVAARLVELASSAGDLDALPEATRRYVALRPEEAGVAVQVSSQLVAAGRIQAAYDLLVALVADVPALGETIEITTTIGSIAEQGGDDAEALRWYEAAVNAGQRDPRFWLNLARVLARAGDPAAAREAMNLAKGLLAGGG